MFLVQVNKIVIYHDKTVVHIHLKANKNCNLVLNQREPKMESIFKTMRNQVTLRNGQKWTKRMVEVTNFEDNLKVIRHSSTIKCIFHFDIVKNV